MATAGCTTEAAIGDGGAGGLAPDGSTVHLVGSGQRVLTYGVGAGTLVKPAGTAGCLGIAASASCAGGLRGVDDTVFSSAVSAGQVILGGQNGLAFLTRSALTSTPEVATPKPAKTLKPDAKRKVKIPVRCTGDAACKGTLTLTSTKKVRPAPGKPAKVVTFGSARFMVAAGRTATVTLTVSKANAALLKRLKSVGCTATAKVGTTKRTARATLKP